MITQPSLNTIAAIATPPGVGGVGIIRVSGPKAFSLAEQLTHKKAAANRVIVCQFKAADGQVIDTGLLLGFKAPHSFTGEDVVEIHGHGGPVVQDLLLKAVLDLGAVQARAGEFSERAFLNNKLDLTQAEAIADLINSSTEQAARGAIQSLSGAFSQKVTELLEQLIALRAYTEAAIDFPDEEIDFLADSALLNQLTALRAAIQACLDQAQQGAVLAAGSTLVLAGKPNAGKSSLLNALAGDEAAIVTPIAGTTRDIVKATVDIDGLAVHILDTAGLRDTEDEVERIGVARAKEAIAKADQVLFLVDSTDSDDLPPLQAPEKTTVVNTKQDLLKKEADSDARSTRGLFISVKTGAGLEALKNTIKNNAGYGGDHETVFTARRRHVTCLQQALAAVDRGIEQLTEFKAGELLAAELTLAQNAMNEITGAFTPDDLLGRIFGSFCIGK